MICAYPSEVQCRSRECLCSWFSSTFTPQLAEADPPRPITTDDLERDRIMGQRIALFGWIEEKHLDVPEGPDARGFLMFAQQGSARIYGTHG